MVTKQPALVDKRVTKMRLGPSEGNVTPQSSAKVYSGGGHCIGLAGAAWSRARSESRFMALRMLAEEERTKRDRTLGKGLGGVG